MDLLHQGQPGCSALLLAGVKEEHPQQKWLQEVGGLTKIQQSQAVDD